MQSISIKNMLFLLSFKTFKMNATLFRLNFSSKIIIFYTIYFHLIFNKICFSGNVSYSWFFAWFPCIFILKIRYSQEANRDWAIKTRYFNYLYSIWLFFFYFINTTTKINTTKIKLLLFSHHQKYSHKYHG